FPGFQNTSGRVTILYGVSRLQGLQDIDAIVAAGGGVQIAGSVFSDKIFGFGDSIAAAGDDNQDGLTDLGVADPLYRDSLGAVRGRVHLVYGSRSFPSSVESDKLGTLGVTIENDQELHGSIPVVFGGGDLDGDGVPDFGFSILEQSGFVDRGRLLILRG